jgi:hypothetical protein
MEGLGSDWRVLQQLLEGEDGESEAAAAGGGALMSAEDAADFFLESAGTAQLPLRQEGEFVPEDSRDLQWHHERLREFASAGKADLALEVLAEMTETGLHPGPKAFHAACFAFCRGGEVLGAVGVLRQAVEAGVRPLPESFWEVLRALGSGLDWPRMRAVLQCMGRLNYDKDKWLIPGLREILFCGLDAVRRGQLQPAQFVEDVWHGEVLSQLEERFTEVGELRYHAVPWMEHLVVRPHPHIEELWEPLRVLDFYDDVRRLYDADLMMELGEFLTRCQNLPENAPGEQVLADSMRSVMALRANSVRMFHWQFLVQEALYPQAYASGGPPDERHGQVSRFPNGTYEAGLDMLRQILLQNNAHKDWKRDCGQLFATVLHFCLVQNDSAEMLAFQLQEIEDLRFQHGVLGDQYYHFMFLLGAMRCESLCRQPDLLMDHFYYMMYNANSKKVLPEADGKQDMRRLFLSKEKLLPNLVHLLCSQGRAEALLYVLRSALLVGVELEPEAFRGPPGEDGLTAATSWMGLWEELQSLKTIEKMRASGVEIYDKYGLEGMVFDQSGWLLQKRSFRPVALSNMRKAELMAELEYRGLSTEGVRENLAARLKAARAEGPAPYRPSKSVVSSRAAPEHPAKVWDRMRGEKTEEAILQERFELATSLRKRKVQERVVSMWRDWRKLKTRAAKEAEAERLQRRWGVWDYRKDPAVKRRALERKGHDLKFLDYSESIAAISDIKRSSELALKIMECVRQLGGAPSAADVQQVFSRAIEQNDWASAQGALEYLTPTLKLEMGKTDTDLYAELVERCLQADGGEVVVEVMLNDLEASASPEDLQVLEAMRRRFGESLVRAEESTAVELFPDPGDAFWDSCENPFDFIDWGELRDFGVLEVFAFELAHDPMNYEYEMDFGMTHYWETQGAMRTNEERDREFVRAAQQPVPWEERPPPWRVGLNEAELDAMKG